MARRRNYDASPEAIVRALLSTTKKGLRHKRGVNPDYVFPHELIERGEEKRPIKRGEATYQEYAVALRHLERQESFHRDDIAALREHSDQVAEDARDLPWTIVRNWSEEIFNRIADGRLPLGWTDPAALLNARTAQIQIATIKLATSRQESGYGRSNTGSQAPAFDRDDKSMGKPCGPWNRNEANCDKAAKGKAHMEDDLKLVHMCAYCAYKLGKMLGHSEAACGNKRRNNDKKTDDRKGF